MTRDVHDTIFMAYELFNDDGTLKKKMKSDMRMGITGIPLEHGDLPSSGFSLLHAAAITGDKIGLEKVRNLEVYQDLKKISEFTGLQ